MLCHLSLQNLFPFNYNIIQEDLNKMDECLGSMGEGLCPVKFYNTVVYTGNI